MAFRPVTAASFALILSVTAAHAQTPPSSGQPQRITASADPSAIPGDFVDMPQAGQLKVPLGPPPGPRTGVQRAPSPGPASPGSALALKAAQAALASCAADGYNVAVAVTDAAGNLKAALTADNVPPNRVYMALRKDLTAATFGMTTLELRAKIAADPSVMAQVTPNMALLPGGLPIKVGDRVVGAIAASGATAYEEEKCGRDGILKIQSLLK